MTCIVGLVESGVIWLGSDSAGSGEHDEQEILKNPKVFAKRGPKGNLWLFGFAGRYRLGQLVEHSLVLPNVSSELKGNFLVGFLVNEFVKDLRRCLRENGAMIESQKNRTENCPGDLIIGVNEEIFTVDEYFQVLIPSNPFTSIGNGSAAAFGALGATKNLLGPEERILTSLEQAQEYIANVSDPFLIINSKDAEESVRYVSSVRRKPKSKR